MTSPPLPWSDDAKRASELRLLRICCLLGAGVYPCWGLVCELILPGSVNLHGQRLVVAAILAGLAIASYRVPTVTRHPNATLAVGFAVILGHYAVVVAANAFAPFYLVGVFITLGAIDALIVDVWAYLAFSGWALAIAAFLASRAPAGAWAPLLLAGVVTQQALFAVTLVARTALVRRLTAAHETISAQNAQLVALGQARDRFIQTVGHELRNPMTAMRGYVELLEDEPDLNPDSRLYVQQLDEANHRLARVVDDLLDFARMEAGLFRVDPHADDMREVVHEVLAALAPTAKAKGVALAHELPPEPLVVPMDRGRIAQVLGNLVGNALKFTPDGGRITVAAVDVEGRARVEVRDSGRGIPADAKAKLFQRFSQVEAGDAAQLGGLGLGLAISKSLVDAHQGTIGVESEVGRGSTFWFVLPP